MATTPRLQKALEKIREKKRKAKEEATREKVPTRKTFTIDPKRCPRVIILASHWNEDGSCKCEKGGGGSGVDRAHGEGARGGFRWPRPSLHRGAQGDGAGLRAALRQNLRRPRREVHGVHTLHPYDSRAPIVDVRIWAFDLLSERCTAAVVSSASPRRNIRPVYCPSCGLHYTVLKDARAEWAPTVVHVVCWDCGGNGVPSSLEAPR